jgi:hypothetical protein
MDHMPSPFKTLPSLAAIGLSVALLTGPANAVPTTTAFGLTSPGFQVHDAGYYKQGKRRSLYVEDYYAPNYAGRSYRAMPYGGSDEVRELQRFHPETLWPPSMRYFPYR